MSLQKKKEELAYLLYSALTQEVLDSKLIEKLLSDGADIDLANNMGWTYLQKACFSNDIRLVERIIKIGANINHADVSGWTTLHEASEKGHLEIVKLLLRANADPNKFLDADDKRTPFDVASVKGHVGIALYLKEVSNEKA